VKDQIAWDLLKTCKNKEKALNRIKTLLKNVNQLTEKRAVR